MSSRIVRLHDPDYPITDGQWVMDGIVYENAKAPDLDAYALRVAEAVREACAETAAGTRPPEFMNDETYALVRSGVHNAARTISDSIRALDLRAILKGVKR